MRNFASYLLSFLVLITTISCKAQLVQTVADVKKLETHKNEFVGKPLKKLLTEIKPSIKRVSAIAGGTTTASHIFLNFVSDSTYNEIVTQTGKSPLLLDIQVAEGDFTWHVKEKPNGHKYNWTKADEKEFGKLTVVDIRVRGGSK